MRAPSRPAAENARGGAFSSFLLSSGRPEEEEEEEKEDALAVSGV